jgi:beta-mannosidase
MKRVDLNGDWQFRSITTKRKGPGSHKDVRQWLPASVPGTVHTDLLAAGIIPDPFYRMNELDVQWVDQERWCYRKEFDVAKEFLDHQEVFLIAEGLDTYADITINGKPAGASADMFVEHRFNVKRFLKVGRNVLEIVFDSPTIRTKQLEERYGPLQVSHEPHRTYARKAQYSFGWDWGPKLTTSGIWRPIYLEAFSTGRIKSVFARAIRVNKQSADVRVDVELERDKATTVRLNVELTGEGFEFHKSYSVRGSEKSFVLKIPKPHLWWPNGYGSQPLYLVNVSLEVAGVECDNKAFSFGIRTIRLLQEKDDEGKTFIFEVNGEKIYCKGADWIPSDNFIPRIQASTYERLLTMARDANMNMVRVWGGGIYEQDVFYELCDRLGLMVWQDFMFACGEYPEDKWFLGQVEDEATKAVTRLRNHPSIVLWCGNNECEWIFCRQNPGKKPDDMNGAVIFRDLLPGVCGSLDGSRPYWRSSPFGSGFPNDESNGNHHEWDVWGVWKDYRDYEKVFARFVTEFGFQAPANSRTMEPVTLPSDRHPQSKVLEHHNKLPEGTERLYRFLASHLPVGGDYEDFVYKGQLVQAEALKTATEHWRRRKFKTAGSMFWQLNDCWPVSSWSVIDSALRPKAAYFYAKKFYAPVLVSFKQTANGLEIWGTNDRLSRFQGDLQVRLRSFTGDEVWSKTKRVSIGRNSSEVLMRIEHPEMAGADPVQHYVLAQLHANNEDISANRFFLTEPKHMHGQTPAVVVEFKRINEQSFQIGLTSKTFVKNAGIEFEGEDIEVDDNYFDIDPGSIKTVNIRTRSPLESVQRGLKIRTLWGVIHGTNNTAGTNGGSE